MIKTVENMLSHSFNIGILRLNQEMISFSLFTFHCHCISCHKDQQMEKMIEDLIPKGKSMNTIEKRNFDN